MADDIMAIIKARDPHEREFHQAVSEVLESVKPVLDRNPLSGRQESWRGSPNRSG